MTAVVDGLDMIEEMFNYIKNEETSLSDFLKEHGGTNIYIPSYKTVFRDQEIISAYKKDMTKATIRKLSREYDLSEQQIYKITKEVREPKLF